jgi:hypothetical protein
MKKSYLGGIIVLLLILNMSIVLGDVFINEFMANPSGPEPASEWIELYYNGTGSINLTDWYINDTNDQGNNLTGSLNSTNRYIVFNGTQTGISLLNSANGISLYDNSNALMNNIAYTTAVTDESEGRIHDGLNTLVKFTVPTPNAINNILPTGTIANQPIDEDVSGSFNVTDYITDADNDDLTFTIVDTNASEVNCIINDTNVTLTPYMDWNGVASCTVLIDDSYSLTNKTFLINVNPINDIPTIISPYPLEVDEEDTYLYDVEATDVENDTLTYSLLEKPSGMIIDSVTGLINWTPDDADVADWNISVKVEDAGDFDMQNFTITVNPVNDAPTINITEIVIAVEDINKTLNVSKYVNDVDNNNSLLTITEDSAYAAVNGQIITFNYPNGILEEEVTITVSDGARTGSQTINVTITPVNDAPFFISTPSSLTAIEDIQYTYDANADDIDNNVSNLVFSIVTAPAGAIIDSSTGVFTWTPTAIQADTGRGEVEIKVEDSEAEFNFSTQKFNLTTLHVLDIIDIVIQGENVLSGDTVSDIAPGDIVNVQYKVKNRFPAEPNKAIVGIETEADINAYSLTDSTSGIILEGQETELINYNLQIPYNANFGNFDVNISVEGRDLFEINHSSSKTIKLVLDRDFHRVEITDKKWTKDNLTCLRDTKLNITLVNTGNWSETGTVTVYNEITGTDETQPFTLNVAQQADIIFNVDASAALSDETFSITVNYYNNYYTIPNSIDLLINDCLDVASLNVLLKVNESEAPTWSPIDLTQYTNGYTPGLSYQFAGEDDSLIDCNITLAGMFTCGTPVDDLYGLSVINMSIGDIVDQFNVEVLSKNDAPVAYDVSESVDEDGSVLIELNCSDVDSASLSYIADSALNGIVSVSVSSTTYTPNTNYYGPDSFTYKCNDGTLDSNIANVDITVNSILDEPEIISRDPEEDDILIGDGEDEKLKITVNNSDNVPYVVRWYINGVLNETNALHPSDEYQFNFEAGDDDAEVEAKVENLAGTEVYDEFEWEFSVKLIPETDYEGTISEVPESEVSNFTNLTIIKRNIGKIDFGNQTIDLSDIVDVDANVIIGNGIVGIDTDSHDFDIFKTTPATITMYGLTSASTPAIYYNSGFTTTGTDVCNAGTDPACTNIVYDAVTGTLVFDVSHFTVFFLNNPPVITSTAVTTAIVNEAYSYQVVATDPESDPLTYSLTGPSGMIISPTGLISWTPANITTENVTVSVSDNTNTIIQSFEIDVNEGPKFIISDLDMKVGGESAKNLQNGEKIPEDAKPGDKVKFDIELENLFSTDIEIQDIEVIVTIENIDDSDDLEEEETIDDIEDGDHDSVTLDFTIPTLVEDGEYNIIIEVDAEDEDGNDQDIRWELTLEVKKDKHDLIIDNADLNPSLVRCNRNPTLDIEVINIGRDDEDDVSIKISNDDLGIDIEEEDIELEEGDSDDSVFEKTYRLKISDDVKSGTYPITVKTYYDGKKSDEKTVDLTIGKCIDTVIPLEREQVDVITTTDKVIKPAEPTVTKISFKETSEYITLLAIAFIILLGGIVFLVGATVILMKK